MKSEEETDSAKGRRKRSEDRLAEIVRLAEQQILETGSTAISINAVSEAAGASRTLVYAYFSERDDLIEAVLALNLERLAEMGIEAASTKGDVNRRATECGMIYLRHVALYGPVLHFILREMQTTPASVSVVFRRLAATARRDLLLPPHEAMALVEILTAIPEELGRMVRGGELELQSAESVCERLLLSGVDSLRPSKQVPPSIAG